MRKKKQIFSPCTVAPVDHVRLGGPSSPRWAPLHTRTRPASLYLNTQCARPPLALIHLTSNFPSLSPSSSAPKCSTCFLHLIFSTSLFLHWVSAVLHFLLCICPHIITEISVSLQSLALLWFIFKDTLTVTLVPYFSQAINTHNLFFPCHNTSQNLFQ